MTVLFLEKCAQNLPRTLCPFLAINISIQCCTFPWKNVPRNCLEICANSAIHISIYCCTFPWKTCPEIASKSVQKHAQKLPPNLCKLNNKSQHLLLYFSLENVPKNCLEICAKTCPETASKSVQTQQ